MKIKNTCGGLLLIGLIILISIGTSFAEQQTLEITQAELTAAGVDTVNLSFSIGAAKVTLVPSQEAGVAVRAVVDYSHPDLAPDLTTSVSGTTFNAAFRSGVILGPVPSGTVHEWQIAIGGYGLDTQLTVNFGGVMADLDLGLSPLKILTLNLGGDAVNLDFSSPTSRTVEQIIINGGGATLNGTNLGNTDFLIFRLNGGALYGAIDFLGALQDGKHNVQANLASGALQLTVPGSAGESVKAVTTVAVVNVAGDGWETLRRGPFRKEYITSDYNDQTVQLDISLVAAASSVNISRQ